LRASSFGDYTPPGNIGSAADSAAQILGLLHKLREVP